MSEATKKELTNLIGQYFIASFQADKLADMIDEAMASFDAHEIKVLVRGDNTSVRIPRDSYVITLRIERIKPKKIEP